MTTAICDHCQAGRHELCPIFTCHCLHTTEER